MYTGKDADEFKEEDEKEWDPAPILACSYYTDDPNKFLITADKDYKGYVYVCTFGNARPIRGIDYNYRNASCNSINLSFDEDLMAIGLSNGRYQVIIRLNKANIYRFDI
jgi:hypothetical protein